MRKRTCSLNKSEKRVSLNINGIRNEMNYFLIGTLTTLCYLIYYSNLISIWILDLLYFCCKHTNFYKTFKIIIWNFYCNKKTDLLYNKLKIIMNHIKNENLWIRIIQKVQLILIRIWFKSGFKWSDIQIISIFGFHVHH